MFDRDGLLLPRSATPPANRTAKQGEEIQAADVCLAGLVDRLADSLRVLSVRLALPSILGEPFGK
jgi:hypothetical protein